MLDIRAEIQGDKVIIEGLERFSGMMPEAIAAGLADVVQEAHREAYEFLSGPKRDTGGYPVPVKTGHLRGALDFLGPGESKTAGGQTFTTDDLEALLYDSAIYAAAIHRGSGSSAKFGPRAFLTDAVEAIADGVPKTMEAQISRAQREAGL